MDKQKPTETKPFAKNGTHFKNKMFAKAYWDNGGVQSKAYKQTHPNAGVGTCKVSGHRKMKNPEVQKEVLKEAEKRGITKEALQDFIHDVIHDSATQSKDKLAGAKLLLETLGELGKKVEITNRYQGNRTNQANHLAEANEFINARVEKLMKEKRITNSNQVKGSNAA